MVYDYSAVETRQTNRWWVVMSVREYAMNISNFEKNATIPMCWITHQIVFLLLDTRQCWQMKKKILSQCLCLHQYNRYLSIAFNSQVNTLSFKYKPNTLCLTQRIQIDFWRFWEVNVKCHSCLFDFTIEIMLVFVWHLVTMLETSVEMH